MRILLAGVPFGCDNVGDEAILACAVALFREVAPQATLTVSTGDDNTASELGVNTCGLFGFAGGVSHAEMNAIIGQHDVFVWCGATGLSDYPEVTLQAMRCAQQLGKKTILWGVGMNDELNPAFYRIKPGKRHTILSILNRLAFNSVDTISLEERRRVAKTKRHIAHCLNNADLIVVRDPESKAEVLTCGVTREVIVGADSALLLKPASLETMALPAGVMDVLCDEKPKIGLCVSAQGAIAAERDLAACLDQIITESQGCLVGIPMNPLTDSALMARLAGHMQHRRDFLVLTGRYQPTEILAVASRMNVIVSSRLHLLILASIVGVPIVGIARGSKVGNYLNNFGLTPKGNVNDCDFESLKSEVLKWMRQANAFGERCRKVHADHLQRMDRAKQRLAEVLSGNRL